MKFKISRHHLLLALNTVSRAVSSKNPRLVLTGIKFELNQNGLYLTGSDNDVTIVTKIPYHLNEDNIIHPVENGVMVLSAKYITEIVRKLEGQMINFEVVDKTILKIQDDVSNFSINCMDSSEYPLVDLNLDGSIIEIKAKELEEIINQTIFAASSSETRPILTGINFKCEDNVLECVATDSYRLAKKTLTLKNSSSFNVTIPSKTLLDISRILEGEKNVKISVSEKKVSFQFEKTFVSTRVINGTYPDTSKLIPTSFENKLLTLSQSLISAIDRASILFASSDKCVVRLFVDDEKAEISSRSQDIGSVVEKITTYRYEGDALDVSFTAPYLIDAIRAIGTEEVYIFFNGDTKPFIVQSKDDRTITQLVLPVRTY